MKRMMTRTGMLVTVLIGFGWIILAAYAYGTDACPPTPGVLPQDDVARGQCLFKSPTAFGQNPQGPFPSCASCHYGAAFTDRAAHFNILTNAQSQKIQVLRNTPSLFNAALTAPYSWDGRNKTIQDQSKEAILNPLEINGNTVTSDQLNALAAFVSSIKPPQSAYDRFVGGDSTALSAAAQQGMAIFQGKGLCSTCHTPPLFTNNQFRKNQINATFSGQTDPGAGFVGTGPAFNFNVPQLRAIGGTGPYMHSGGLGTLEQVVRFYNKSLALGLTYQELSALVEFLRAL